MMTRKIILFSFCWILIFNSHAAIPQIGMTLAIPQIIKDPADLHGLKGSVWIQPNSLIWQHCQLYFETSYSHWKISGAPAHLSLDIYTIIAPVFRAYMTQHPLFSTYIEASIGPSYLTRTRLSNRNLGIHFAFQDYVGIGALIGQGQKVAVSLDALHYSNGCFSYHNSGITIPLMVTMGYRFF